MILFLLAVVSLASAVKANPINSTYSDENRIIGGNGARIETYPYQVSLQDNAFHICGASIVSAKYVLTAGHCVLGNVNANRLTIRAGSSIRERGGSIHQVDKVIEHEKFSSSDLGIPSNDIAIMRVKQPFKFDNSRQPITLVSADYVARAGARAVVTGWGITKTGPALQLQTVTIPIINQSLCNQAYKKVGGLPDGQICAAYYGVGGKDACQGDSGGPLAIDGRLAGIVSWGDGCAEPDHPGAYTEIAYYRSWIKKHIKV